mgnify:FL=1
MSKLLLIPAAWRNAVIAILESGDKNRIISTETADRDWNAAFPHAFMFARHQAMAQALQADIHGRHIADMRPACDAYEFWFFFDQSRVLGKIGLLPNGKIIIIFSSHIPRKGDSL